MDYVTRIHLKTDGVDRNELIDFCLHNKSKQYVVIGWSCVYSSPNQFQNYAEYYQAVKKYESSGNHRINPAHNIFGDAEKDDLFWTRDLEGYYWICRVKEKAYPHCDEALDIGAVIPVEAYRLGIDVPGQISSSFSRPRGGITEKIRDSVIIEYSKHIFNKVSGKEYYEIDISAKAEILDNLPPLDLEELVIAFIQIKEGYYVLSNSIARKSTTVKIECEFRSRSLSDIRKAVVQVKGGNKKHIDALDYKQYEDDGYMVYLYAPYVDNLDKLNHTIRITKEELLSFYYQYKANLPKSITQWEELFS